MLRMIFVVVIIVVGMFFAVQSAFYGLLFYLWNAYFRPDDWSYFGFIRSLRLSLIVGAYVVVRAIASAPRPKLGFRTMLIWLFLGQALIGCFTSENPDWSWPFLEDFAKVLIISYLIIVLVNDRKQFRLVLLVIAVSLGFETAKQGWATTILSPGAVNNNMHIFLGDNNGVALGCMMLLPILGALARTSRLRMERYTHRFFYVGVFLRGISTYSRGGFLGAAALGSMALLRGEKKIRAAIVIVVLGLVVWRVMPQKFWDRMDTITVEDEEQRDNSSAGRLHFWEVSVDMASAKPLTGVGLYGFLKSYESYNTDERFLGERAAHSIWFGVLGDLGYPGLVLFIANIGMALWSCWQVVRLARQNAALHDLKVFANALISTLVVYCVTGTFLSAHYSEMAWHMIALSSALNYVAVAESNALRAGPVQTRAA